MFTKIIERWNILLVIPRETLDVVTEPIYVKNGVLQGDPISADLYTLSKNPISWELRKNKGYMISKQVASKITHSLFIDDIKTHNKSVNEQRCVISDTRSRISDAGLEWNIKKYKVLNMKRGKVDESEKYLTLMDGSKIECLNSEDRYKFLGVPENKEHNVEDIVLSLN